MIDNRITTIFFDVGRTLRKNVPNPATRDYWLEKIISTTGISWTPDELARQITCRLGAYKKWASESLEELRVYDQRGEHDARLHLDLDVPEDVAGHGHDLPGAHRPPDSRRPAAWDRPALTGAAGQRGSRNLAAVSVEMRPGDRRRGEPRARSG